MVCKFCGKQLERKRINGRLEDKTVFSKRKYCNRLCMAKGYTRLTVSRSGYLSRARKFLKSECETCKQSASLRVYKLA